MGRQLVEAERKKGREFWVNTENGRLEAQSHAGGLHFQGWEFPLSCPEGDKGCHGGEQGGPSDCHLGSVTLSPKNCQGGRGARRAWQTKTWTFKMFISTQFVRNLSKLYCTLLCLLKYGSAGNIEPFLGDLKALSSRRVLCWPQIWSCLQRLRIISHMSS